MQAVTNYTDTDAIRAAVGISEEEVPDEVLTALQLDLQLTVALDVALPDHAALYAAGQVATPDAVALKNHRALRLHAQFWCAAEVLGNDLIFTKVISDGKNRTERFSDVNRAALRDTAAAKAAYYLTLISTFTAGDSTRPTLIGSAAPDTDPVLNT